MIGQEEVKVQVLLYPMLKDFLPHSSSDDHRKYRNDKDLNNDKNKDPISIFEKICIDNNILTKKDINNIQNKIKSEIDTAALWAPITRCA